MSQSGVLTVQSGGGAVVETFTGNSGGAVGPDGSYNINLLGNNMTGINVVGNPGTHTLTIASYQATTSQEGTLLLATNAQAIAGTDTSNAVTSAALGAKLGTQTAHSLAVFEGTASALTALGVATNGQLPIGSTGADPVLATLTAGTGITITNGAGSITIAANGSAVVETLTGNSGGAISPTAGNINTLGTGSITIVGSGSTLTTELTGLTNHAVQVGAGTATLTQLAVGSNGQVLIGSTGADPAFATLSSSDSSISFTTGANTLSLQVAGGSTTIKTITGNSGGAESPSSGNFNIVGTGSITVAGSANTETVQLTGLTTHNVLIGAGSATITKVAPSATSGIPLISQGSSSDPAFGTAVVAGGGTGNTTFTAYAPICAGTTATGAFQSASTGFGTSGHVLTSTGSSSLPSWQAVSGVITTIDGDSGSATGATVTIEANVAANNCGSTVHFSASGSTVTMNLSDGNTNSMLGIGSGPSGAISGSYNLGIGYQALSSLSTSNSNVAFGRLTLNSISSGNGVNIGVGQQALQSLSTGELNVAIGYEAGNAYTSSESNNIIILNSGVNGESNTIHIGTQGNGVGQQNITYIAGIYPATPTSANNPQVVLCDNVGNLTSISSSTSGYVLTSNGSATPSFQAASSGLTLDGDSGSATGATITIEADVAANNCGSTVNFTASGSTVLMNLSDGNTNSTLGIGCGPSGAISGSYNVGIGYQNLSALSTSTGNISFGRLTLNTLAGGNGVNVSVGQESLRALASGEVNVAIGYQAGGAYTAAESHNILILNSGVNGESNTIHIGTQGTGVGQQNVCYIAGITGVAVSNSAAVLLNTSTGQLGTMVSSRRYKEDIQEMGDRSSQILNLRPVTFTFKSDRSKELHFGLIAEEVEETMPELVTYNDEGLPETVRYHDIPVFLLNELIKLRKEVEYLKTLVNK